MKAPLPETKLNYIKASFTQYIITNNKDFMKKMSFGLWIEIERKKY